MAESGCATSGDQGATASLEEKLIHVEKYETVMPRKMPVPRGKRELSALQSTYPDHVLYSIRAEGKDYLLWLEKNKELLGQQYTETHYLADGTEVTEKPDIQDHCLYQGHVQGYTDSAVSISTCSGLSGFFRVNETTFLLEPLEEDAAGQHAVYRAAHLRGKSSVCPESSATLEYDHEPKIPAAMKLYHWRSASLQKGPRYVELVLVVDNEEFRKYKDLPTVQNRMKEIVNHVDKDHSMNPIGAASTMAHEMGHNLGMSHDEDVAGCLCPVPKADGGCVMAASVGLAYPKRFSRCSEQDMWQFLRDPRTSCLLNIPRVDELYGGPLCGNRFVERGEQCDCGTLEECSDRCCNATTCQLKEGAECAQGDCCQDCKVKVAGVLCRASKNDCDLPEHCTGFSAECPEDVFQENGIPCQNGNGYCYNGACPSHSEQCRMLWGAGAQVAPDVCFKHNSEQHLHLHCLTDYGKGPCSPRDVKCGTLLCLSDTTSPVLGGGSYSLFLGHFKCKAVIASNDANEVMAKLRLVPTGTKCGDEMVCYAGRCQNLLVYGNKNCSAKCNNHGVCNHKQECHCEPGWAAPYCEQKISGMVAGSSSVVLAVVLGVLVLSSILLSSSFMFLRGRVTWCFRKGRTSGGPMSGLADPLFQEGCRIACPRRQLSHRDISHPNLLSSTVALGNARPLMPCSPALQVREPKGAPAQSRYGQLGRRAASHPSFLLTLQAPELVPKVTSPGWPSQVKPKPPTKPLPALRNKALCNGEGLPGPVLPHPPRTTPSVLQQDIHLKVALKLPPTARR